MRWRSARTAPTRPVTGTDFLAATDISVSLGGRRVLREVSLTVRTGEVLALVGPNGAGKSTLLAALAADLPSTGDITLAGRPIGDWTVAELARHRSVLPQHPTLSFPFPVADVVAMGRAPWATTEAADEDEAVVTEAMELCEVTAFAERPFGSLSGGERARVALARVLAQRTPLVMLDEPTAALDLRHQELVMRVCRARAGSGDAVVVVLHDLGLAAAYCDRVAVMHDGRVAACGSPREVFAAELLSEVYRQPVDVFSHPGRDELLVVPRRSRNLSPQPIWTSP
ncbi:heme ABC transporter ATP-binding protein [Phytomonospora endophytica]|uniref:Iron complex transport system ATP-binding protein n=1 Tax=Phytomonospora endophytica TaxID=714109 RepID=A0A841FR35_9ACTN|nr:heme ABC transporter ATP-binding protein [Phytomonospora endophytica]MBB6036248.1 iron complex transport system ATP-binding protein [Phytomonospora endophytica]GIG67155.1 hemin import ATP-binding protein HmuV [Phytomonospora endophytica]